MDIYLPNGMNGSTITLINKSERAKLNINTFNVVCSSLLQNIAPIINIFPLVRKDKNS
jgi:hypothetical protein